MAGLPAALEPLDWSSVSVSTDLYLGTVRSSVGGLVDKFQVELQRLYAKGRPFPPPLCYNRPSSQSTVC